MRIHLRFNTNHGEHSNVTLFMNGASTGDLTMRQCEARMLHSVLAGGAHNKNEFMSSGESPAIVEESHECSVCIGTGWSGKRRASA